ncbi:unnamed protein product [Calypogeia fissa]
MARSSLLVVFLVLGIVLSLRIGGIVEGALGQQLSTDFYNVTCPSVEQIVRNRMNFHFQLDPSITAHLLRLQFHDCGATGCDASLLLTGPQSEQFAEPNLTVLGYDIIEDIKAQLEMNCTGIVSCADIIALAARDSVALTGGPSFSVPLGRFDSLVSGGINVNLPSPDGTVSDTIKFFQTVGLNASDLVILLGAHTIGVAHCSSFVNRLYNFQSTGAPDPSIDPTFLATLQQTCPQGQNSSSSFMALDDFSSVLTFDNDWYSRMQSHDGVLTIDQELADSNLTSTLMGQMALNQSFFFESFAASMVKMGMIGVKTAANGDIRTNCSVAGTSTSAVFAPAPSPTTGADSPVGSPQVSLSPSPSPSSGA